jgi:aminoglycoside 2'-N-acetyltransferase I
VTSLRTAHTSALDPATLASARDLLDQVFGDMTDADWDHSLGGIHALAFDGDTLVGHASVIQRRLLHSGRALRTGYVEGVAVHADWRRRGVGGALMASIEQVIQAAYDIGALGATDEGAVFYAARGWQLWRGPTSVLTPSGIQRTEEDDGAVYVFPVGSALDLAGELTCDWRDGDVW